MNSALQEIRIPAPELRGAVATLAQQEEMELGIDGPAGCVAGETQIYNPVTQTHTPIKELHEKGIAPIVQTLMGAIQAEVPFRKGVKELYRVTLASGRQVVTTDNHLFLTPDGWRFLSACAPDSQFLISSPCPLPTTEVLGPLVSPQDALRLSQTPLGSQESCQTLRYSCDVPPQSVEDIDQVLVPSQADVHVHIHDDLCKDDWESLQGYTRQRQSCGPHAKTYYSPSTAYMACTQFHAQQETSLQVDASCQYDALSQREIRLPLPTAQLLLDDDNMRRRVLSLKEYQRVPEVQLRDDVVNSIPGQLAQCYVSSDTTQGCAETLLASYVYNPSMNTSNTIVTSDKCDCSILWDTVSSIKYERTDEYFDLHVPIANHYLAEGIWHHNTGKTYGILYFIHSVLSAYPGAKWLVSRKHNTDLAGSAMATLRESVLDPHENVNYFGGNKVRPAAYEYPNGSVMIVNGLDKPGKVKSMDFDGIYINEATECSLDDIEFCRMRMARRKNSTVPKHLRKFLMDYNPDSPVHFLYQRMQEGLTKQLLSRHEDNPFLFDAKTNDWTPEGRFYIEEVLGKLTGVRLARYRFGLWASSEGTVYEGSWDRARNVVKRFGIPASWERYVVLDFGYTHPFVCKWYALDPDGRLYCYREWYKTKMLVEDHAKEIKRLSRWGEQGGDPFPREVICDHDAEGREVFTRHTGLYTTPAQKAVSEGIQAVSSMLRPAGDGKPRLMYFEDALVERDPELVDRKLPTSGLDEFDMYVWKKDAAGRKDEPVKEYDHSLDCDRYMCMSLSKPSGVSYFPSIWT